MFFCQVTRISRPREKLRGNSTNQNENAGQDSGLPDETMSTSFFCSFPDTESLLGGQWGRGWVELEPVSAEGGQGSAWSLMGREGTGRAGLAGTGRAGQGRTGGSAAVPRVRRAASGKNPAAADPNHLPTTGANWEAKFTKATGGQLRCLFQFRVLSSCLLVPEL